MQRILELPQRDIFLVTNQPETATVYLVKDKDAGGILVNTPVFDEKLLAAIQQEGGASYIFLPSYHGAHDLDKWREALGAEAMAYGHEKLQIDGTVDIELDKKSKLTRTIYFYPMSGVTESSCAMLLKNKPGVMFFGPILTPGEDGWPTLIPSESDHSFESRMFGALGLQDLKYDYAFTDVYQAQTTQVGPEASTHINAAIHRELEL